MSAERLFEPLKVGHMHLSHRMVMAPLTRFRGTSDNNVGPHMRQYYEQRASVPGTLIITESTFVSERGGSYPFIPGIWNDEQAKGWKEITEAVHARGSFISLQLAATGRNANPQALKAKGYRFLSSSAVALDDEHDIPAAMTTADIREFAHDYVHAAELAMKAGFDAVEIHGGNGWLVDQFWQDVVNKRADEYGGSVENRARFGIEVTKAVINAVGDSKRVGMRLSPYSTYQNMGMEDPIPQFLHIVKELKKLDLAYLHLFESRTSGTSVDGVYQDLNPELNPLVEAWGLDSPILIAGGYTPEKARKVLTELHTGDNVCIVFGRYFISTPDLAFRIKNGIPLNEYDRSTFYRPQVAEGYTDYQFSEEWLTQKR